MTHTQSSRTFTTHRIPSHGEHQCFAAAMALLDMYERYTAEAMRRHLPRILRAMKARSRA